MRIEIQTADRYFEAELPDGITHYVATEVFLDGLRGMSYVIDQEDEDEDDDVQALGDRVEALQKGIQAALDFPLPLGAAAALQEALRCE